MKITVVGCGNAFSYKNYNQSFLLESGNQKLLIDCGTRVPQALHDLGINIKDITDIYISHQHGDHCGGLEEVAFTRYAWGSKATRFDEAQFPYAPTLICNEMLMKELWKNTLSGGLESMEGFDANLSTFFVPKSIKANKTFDWQRYKVSLVQQIHIMTGSMIKNTFGLFLEPYPNVFNDTTKLFFTTDAQYFQPEQVRYYYDKADIIFQDCECIGCDTVKKTMDFKSGVHANYGQLAGWEGVNAYRMNPEIKKKIWLSHYQDFVSAGRDYKGQLCDWGLLCADDGFAGFVKVGQTFEV